MKHLTLLNFTVLHPPSPPIIFEVRLLAREGQKGGAGAAHPAVVFRLLPGVIDDLGKDALATAKNSLEVDGLFRQRWHSLQVELILVVTQITVVQS